MRARSLARRWALTPPFHPCPRGRSVFCATFRGSLRAAVNGHPALMEPGLSSLLAKSDRLAHSGQQILSSRTRQRARLAAEVLRQRMPVPDLTVMLLRQLAVMRGTVRDEARRAHQTLHGSGPRSNNSVPRGLGVRCCASGGFRGRFVFVIKNSLAVGAEVDLKMFLDFVEQLRR